MQEQERRSDTGSFKISPNQLGYFLTFIIAALGGGTVSTAIQPAPVKLENYITRQEYEINQRDFEKRLSRIEAKLDTLIQQGETPAARRR